MPTLMGAADPMFVGSNFFNQYPRSLLVQRSIRDQVIRAPIQQKSQLLKKRKTVPRNSVGLCSPRLQPVIASWVLSKGAAGALFRSVNGQVQQPMAKVVSVEEQVTDTSKP